MRHVEHLTQDIVRVRTILVNLYLVRTATSWVLVDAGLRGFAPRIEAAARALTGSVDPPAAIILTHGHFDHVGSLEAVLDRWDVPVYAHRLELPYLTGGSPYPPPDPLVGGGAMALMSRMYPRSPLDISGRVRALPEDGTVPGLPGWRWLHTPGHTAGHVALFRAADKTLLAGDAVTTTKQESLNAVATQRQELHGPPAYFTADWGAAGHSVSKLAALEPELLATGHGIPMRGRSASVGLRRLAAGFDQREVPTMGRYAKQPAVTDERGIVSLPPDPLPKLLAGLATAAIVLGVAIQATRLRNAISH